MTVLAGIALKATVVLLLACALALSLRRASAALRHLVWAAAVCGVLVLPAASFLLPEWSVAEFPAVIPSPGFEANDVEDGRQGETSRKTVASSVATGDPATPPDDSPRRFSLTPLLDASRFLMAVWLAGALLLLAWLGAGLARVRVLARSSEIVRDGSWLALLARLTAELGIRRPVTLRRSRVGAMPMTWGAWRPVILLPADADAWPAERRQDVLLHELAHVRRHDFVSQIAARVACACYWFHPLVWVAARRLRLERERACDDHVIRRGRRASDYAALLLDVARTCSAARAASLAGIAMARRSQLAGRLMDVLDAGRDRDGVPPRVAAPLWTAAALVVLPLGAVAPERAAVEPRSIVPRSAEWEGPRAAGSGSAEGNRLRRGDTLRGCTEGRSTRGTSTNITEHDGRRRTLVRVVAGRCEVLLRTDGKFTFTADFTDIATVAPGGEVVLEVDDGEHERRLKIGRERTYTVDRVARPFDAGARAWLAETLTFLLRHTGLQAEERAQAILEREGIGGLIEEIALLEGDYARRKYYQVAVASGRLDAAGWERLVARAGQEIESDYELAELLIDVARRRELTAAMQAGFVTAAGTIGSDYERRRVLEAALSRPDLTAENAVGMLRAAADIGSDYELAELLIKIQSARPIGEAQRPAFFAAANTIHSDYERRRVLTAVVSQRELGAPALADALESAKAIGSDYELAELLIAVARDHVVPAAVRSPLFEALDSVNSDYERRRVLAAIVAREDLDRDMAGDLLRSARGIDSDFELAELLVALARRVRIDDGLRPAFEAAANTIGSSHENDRVMAALARSQARTPERQ